jgi:AraC family transcriptional regulator of adaptative response/methylated-DNA-[protein]-cysteine methyltransferase
LPDADEQRWQAISRRAAGADGLFWNGVTTTGIYCRPACPSRLPLRQHVVFFDDPAKAQASGFRPCKRCQPQAGAATDRHMAAIVHACRLLAGGEVVDINRVAAEAGMSRFHFQRCFKRVTGITPKAYLDALRDGRLREALARAGSITDAIFAAGFNSSGRFYARSTAVLGMRPRQARAGAGGLNIRFGIGQCSLGAILVAQSERGVCAISLGDDPDALLRELQDRFPQAELIGGDAGFEDLVAKVFGFIEAPQFGLDLPLDVRGTAFQQRVWQALREIPPGQTVSYSEIAQRIGAPKAVRAVAGACAANTLAVAIPCHRVVRSDGELADYRWGVERKRALLEREADSVCA